VVVVVVVTGAAVVVTGAGVGGMVSPFSLRARRVKYAARAGAARLGARGPGAEGALDAVDRARRGVAGAGLGGVRARLVAEAGFDGGAAALLRAGAARLGARGPGAEGALDAVDRARRGVAGAVPMPTALLGELNSLRELNN